jgi:hypothetical protein
MPSWPITRAQTGRKQQSQERINADQGCQKNNKNIRLQKQTFADFSLRIDWALIYPLSYKNIVLTQQSQFHETF